jgi:hypothetical protein
VWKYAPGSLWDFGEFLHIYAKTYDFGAKPHKLLEKVVKLD